jgi:Werner syndrome ATP-dependent helicase
MILKILMNKIFKMTSYKDILFKTFGYKEFRPLQEEIINAVIDRRDCICIMPTSAGKSICYQLPAIIMNKPAVVVSPLLSLMNDQMTRLEYHGISTCCFNGETVSLTLKKNIIDGKFKLIYITPEMIVNYRQLLEDLYKNQGISLIAIDETHCLSNWGHSFRPSYLQLSCIKDWFPDVPILAMTGTATKVIADEIVKLLKLKDPLRILTNPDRPNLSYYVHQKTDLNSIKELINGTEKSIIYCSKRSITEKVASQIVGSRSYHAGLSLSERNSVYEDFISGNINCIVATIAFGMGIDVPNIRKVIHYGAPRDIESYVQEAGRAGRDGLQSECHIFFAPGDFVINRFFIKDIKDQEIKRYREKMVDAIEKYIYTRECRRKLLVSYFGDFEIGCNINCCDNCKLDPETKESEIDIGSEAMQFLKFVRYYTGRFGKTMLIKVLMGLSSGVVEYLKNSYYFGTSTHNKNYWDFVVQQLLNHQLIEQRMMSTGFGSTVHITNTGIQFIENNIKHLMAPEMYLQSKTIKKRKSTTPVKRRNSGRVSPTVKCTYDLLIQGHTPKEISIERKLTMLTVESHIATILEHKMKIDDNLYNELTKNCDEIKNVIHNQLFGDVSKLALIKALCRKEITYLDIKCALALLKS